VKIGKLFSELAQFEKTRSSMCPDARRRVRLTPCVIAEKNVLNSTIPWEVEIDVSKQLRQPLDAIDRGRDSHTFALGWLDPDHRSLAKRPSGGAQA